MAKSKVPELADATTRWAEITATRASRYESETVGTGSEWEKGAGAAGKTFQAAVQVGDIGKRFAGGIKGKAAKFDRKVKDVGVSRFSPGVTAAKTDYADGVDDYLALIPTVEIPERGARGTDSNYDRGEKIGKAEHAKRLALLGAGAV